MTDRQLMLSGLGILAGVVGIAFFVSGEGPAQAESSSETEAPAAVQPVSEQDAGVAYQEALHQAITAARESCLRGWTDTLPPGTEGELVLDAVVVQGRLDRIDLRAVSVHVPADIQDCVRQTATSVYWPKTGLSGQRRFQRTMSIP